MRHLILRVMDSDAAWVGFGWLRPRPDERLSGGAVSAILLVTGLMSLAVGPVVYGLLVLLEGPARPDFAAAAGIASAGAVLLNAVLQLYSAAVWNRRAAALRPSAARAAGRAYDEYD